MLDDYGFEKYEENAFPVAYLLTFGTWLHGDKRGSYSRNKFSKYIDSNVPLIEVMEDELRQKPLVLNQRERSLVHEAIVEVCRYREYNLRALNVRSNHAHAVVSKALKPEKIVNDFKAYATRRLRSEGVYEPGLKIWSRGSSTRYLWKPNHVDAAVEYVLYSQGDVPFETVTKMPDRLD